jgi:hypothetical protein
VVTPSTTSRQLQGNSSPSASSFIFQRWIRFYNTTEHFNVFTYKVRCIDFDYDVDFDDQHDPGKTLIDFSRGGTIERGNTLIRQIH